MLSPAEASTFAKATADRRRWRGDFRQLRFGEEKLFGSEL
jgi:hypothetical protein